MTKVVYNGCYGGFGLSKAAVLRYAALKGFAVYPEPMEIGGKVFPSMTVYFTVPKGEREGKSYGETHFDPSDLSRTDAALVSVVEELGDAANGDCAKLRIQDIPAGTRYRIDEYDGFEGVELADSVDWSVA